MTATPPRLRVALLVNSVAMGGVEEHVRQIAVGLGGLGSPDDHGVDVCVVMPEEAAVDPLAHALERAGVRVVRLTLAWQSHRLGSAWRFLRLVRLLRAWEPAVCHLHLVGYTGGRWLVLATWLAGVPRLLCTIHIAPSYRPGWRVLLDRALVGCLIDRYLAVSRASRALLVENLRMSESRIAVVHNGVEAERFAGPDEPDRARIRAAFNIPASAPVIGAVARLSEQKGLSYLLAAAPNILAAHPEAHLLLVGDGPLRESLEAQAAAANIGPRVHFTGYQPDAAPFLRAMDLFVLPSLYEGLPISVLEAMAAGLPVVATAVDGTPEAVVDGQTAILVPPSDADALAAAVSGLLADRHRAEAMGRAGRVRSASFSTTALLDRLAALYRAPDNDHAAASARAGRMIAGTGSDAAGRPVTAPVDAR